MATTLARFRNVAFDVDHVFALQATKNAGGEVASVKVWVTSSQQPLELTETQYADNLWRRYFPDSKRGLQGRFLLLDDQWGLDETRIAHVTFNGLPQRIEQATVTMIVGIPERYVELQVRGNAAQDLGQVIADGFAAPTMPSGGRP